MHKNQNTLRKVVSLTISFALILLFAGASIAIAAITFSNTSITGDASVNAITATSYVLTVGTSTVNGQLSAGSFNSTGSATFGGALTQSGGLVALATTTVTGLFSSNILNVTSTA